MSRSLLVVVWLIASAGCGRLGFDAAPGTTDAEVDTWIDPTPDAPARPTGPFGAPIPIAELNTNAFEDDPAVTADLLEIYFERSGGPTAIGDLFRARRTSTTEPWGAPELLVELNSVDDDGGPRISADGLTLWFSSDRVGGVGSVDIYRTSRPSRQAPWDPPVLESTINTTIADTLLLTDASQTHAVFSRLGPGLALNSIDLYLTRRASPTEPWGDATAVIELNTSTHGEGAGSLSPDGLVLYLYANVGGGPVNLHRAERAALDQPFGPMVPLDEINSPAREEDPWVTPDGRTLLFSRDGDLYMATRTD